MPNCLIRLDQILLEQSFLCGQLTDKNGPDTGTWSMHTVGWLELGDWDKANEMFSYMFRNINGPFKVILHDHLEYSRLCTWKQKKNQIYL